MSNLFQDVIDTMKNMVKVTDPELIEFQKALAEGRARAAGAGGIAGVSLSDQVWYERKGAWELEKYTESGGARPRNLPMTGKVPVGRKGTSFDAVLNLPYRWVNDKKKMNKLLTAVSAATGKPVTDFFEALEVWQVAVKTANQSWIGTNGGKNGAPLSPWDALGLMSRTPGGYGNSLAKTGPRTTTSRSVNEISDGDAWSVVNRAVTELLGRAASTSELQEFASRANRIAANNPTITRTTTKYDAQGRPVSESSKTQQGASAGDYELAARNMANRDPEAGAYQAAATYYPKLLETLGSMANLRNPA